MRPQTGAIQKYGQSVGAKACTFSKLDTQMLRITTEFEKCQHWRACLIARGMTLLFTTNLHSRPPTLPSHYIIFGVMEPL